MTDLRQAAQQALEALAIADNIALVGAAYTPKSIDLGLQKIRDSATALRAALEQQAEPVAYYHPHKGFYWAKPTYISAPIVVDVPPVPLYVKWKAAQRPWQGLTDEDVNRESAPIAQQMKLAFHAGMYAAQKILKEKNSD